MLPIPSGLPLNRARFGWIRSDHPTEWGMLGCPIFGLANGSLWKSKRDNVDTWVRDGGADASEQETPP